MTCRPLRLVPKHDNVVDLHEHRRKHARKVLSAMQTLIEQRKEVVRHTSGTRSLPRHDTTQPRLPVVAGAKRYQKFPEAAAGPDGGGQQEAGPQSRGAYSILLRPLGFGGQRGRSGPPAAPSPMANAWPLPCDGEPTGDDAA